MAEKKRKQQRPRRRPGRPRTTTARRDAAVARAPAEQAMGPVMDRRLMERVLADMGRVLREHEFASVDEANAFLQEMTASGAFNLHAPQPPSADRTPLEQAQDLVYEALEASGKRRVELARKALAVSPDCADAYVLLAEETARTPKEAKPLYEQGVAAGERALGERAFAEDAGHFWGIIETRPYMRARAGLAQCLWALGERRPAIDHMADMLRLNPDDNQGIRYLLLSWLMSEGDDAAATRLLGQYKDEYSAAWLYARALLAFRREGAGATAARLLTKAMQYNPYVPMYLLGLKKFPRRPPDFVGIGDENEAVDYIGGSLDIWMKTPGVLPWLAARFAAGPSRQKRQ